MQERHTNRVQYFNEQSYTTEKHVIPYLTQYMPVTQNTSVLEIGCGEGGNLQPFLDQGCEVTGIDISKHKIENARGYLNSGNGHADNITLIDADIYDIHPGTLGKFDLIIMRDVIEHIPRQEKFLHFVKQFMHSHTLFFLGFPPWIMPYGGHQQICSNRFLAALPYFHILPQPLYRTLLKWGGESESTIKGLLEIKETGITVERFKKIISKENYAILDESPFFINPNYEIKFKLKPRKQTKFISSIPYVRDLLSTCYYFILKLNTGEPI